MSTVNAVDAIALVLWYPRAGAYEPAALPACKTAPVTASRGTAATLLVAPDGRRHPRGSWAA